MHLKRKIYDMCCELDLTKIEKKSLTCIISTVLVNNVNTSITVQYNTSQFLWYNISISSQFYNILD